MATKEELRFETLSRKGPGEANSNVILVDFPQNFDVGSKQNHSKRRRTLDAGYESPDDDGVKSPPPVGEEKYSADEDRAINLLEMLPELIPEACVFKCDIFRESRSLSAEGLKNAAFALLDLIWKELFEGRKSSPGKILLAGYGLGGIVIKQVVVIANTQPKYYKIALEISNLVFFSTPHRANGLAAWEKVVLSLAEDMRLKLEGRISWILPTLAVSIAQLSSRFFGFLSKYHVTNFTEAKSANKLSIGDGDNNVAVEGTQEAWLESTQLFIGDIETVESTLGRTNTVLPRQIDLPGIAWFIEPDSEYERLDRLRDCFAPPYVLNRELDYPEGATRTLNDAYLDFLQILSPSRWLLYETTSAEDIEGPIDMEETYKYILEDLGLSWNSPMKRKSEEAWSVHITGSQGTGRTRLLKFISQRQLMRTSSSVSRVVIDLLPRSLDGDSPTPYKLWITFLHQILSQQPSLFRYIYWPVLANLRENTWTENNIKILSELVLNKSNSVDILIVIHRFDEWPEAAQSWFRELDTFLKAFPVAFKFLTSGRSKLGSIGSQSLKVFDLDDKIEMVQEAFIQNKVSLLMEQNPGFGIFNDDNNEDIRNTISEKVKTFGSAHSLAAAEVYLKRLSRELSLTTPKYIKTKLESCPEKEEDLYAKEMEEISKQPSEVIEWCSKVLSWVVNSLRPLRVHELAAIVAADEPDVSEFSDIKQYIPRDMNHDLEKHLSLLLKVKSETVRPFSPGVMVFMKQRQDDKKKAPPEKREPDNEAPKGDQPDETEVKSSDLSKPEPERATEESKEGETKQEISVSRATENFASNGKEMLSRDHANLTESCLHYIEVVLRDRDASECISEVSWRRSGSNPNCAELAFLDYAVRFWPEHYLLAMQSDTIDPDRRKNISQRVKKFLEESLSAEKWVQLYMTSHSESSENQNLPPPEPPSSDSSSSDGENSENGGSDSGTSISEESNSSSADKDLSNPDLLRLGHNSGNSQEENEQSSDASVNMARLMDYLGLTAVLRAHTEEQAEPTKFHEINVRRGYSERRISLSRTKSESNTNLHYAICQDSDHSEEIYLPYSRIPIEEANKSFPLHVAAQAGSLIAIQFFGKESDKFFVPDGDKRTPLHRAAIGGHSQILNYMHQFMQEKVKAAIDAQDTRGQTPLILAVRMGNVEATRLLLEAGASRSVSDLAGKTALHYAVSRDQTLVSMLLFNPKTSMKGGKSNALAKKPIKGSRTSSDKYYQDAMDNVKILDKNSETPLHIAARVGNPFTVSEILDVLSAGSEKEEIDIPGNKRGSPLHIAAACGHTEIVKRLLEHKRTKFSARQKHGAMKLAISGGHVSTLKIFVPEPNVKTLKLFLRISAITGQLIVVHHVLSFLKNTKRIPLNFTPILALAVSGGYCEIVRTFFRTNFGIYGDAPDPNAEDRKGRTLLNIAAGDGRTATTQTDAPWVATTRVLLTERANVNALDSQRRAPLHVAAEQGNLHIVELLLEWGAAVNDVGPQQQTALHLAVAHTDILKVLLKSGSRVEVRDQRGYTPLHLAVISRHEDSARMLLDEGAHFSYCEAIEDDARENLLDPMISMDIQVAKAFICDPRYKPPVESLFQLFEKAFDNYRADILETILSNLSESEQTTAKNSITTRDSFSLFDIVTSEDTYTAEISSRDPPSVLALVLPWIGDRINEGSDGKTPLYRAAWHGRPRSAKILLENGADPNIVPPDGGWSPAHAGADNLEITKALLNYKINLDYQKEDGWTPLMLAVYWNKEEITRLYLDHGADPNLRSTIGETALHIAATGGYPELIKILLDKKYKTEIDITNNEDRTPLHTAIVSGIDASVDALLEAGADPKKPIGELGNAAELAAKFAQLSLLERIAKVVRGPLDKESWDRAGLESLWRAAVEGGLKENIEALLKLDDSLGDVKVGELPPLEYRLQSHENISKSEDLVLFLLERRENPFAVVAGDQSPFMMGFLSKMAAKDQFVDACIAKKPEKIEAAGDILKVLQMACLTHRRDVFEAFYSLGEVKQEPDADGWTLRHYFRNSFGEDSTVLNLTEPLDPTPGPSVMQFMESWGWQLSEHEANVTIKPNLISINEYRRITIRSDHPFPVRGTGPQYYEIQILPYEDGVTRDVTFDLRFGVCDETLDSDVSTLNAELGTVVYHAYGGSLYDQNMYIREAPSYRMHQVVGCGIDVDKGDIFFTIDGKELENGRIHTDSAYKKLFPAFTAWDEACRIKVNFGPDFMWNPSGKARADQESTENNGESTSASSA